MNCALIVTEFDHPEVTLCGRRDVKVLVLLEALIVVVVFALCVLGMVVFVCVLFVCRPDITALVDWA